MLEQIRNRTQTKLAKVILAIIIIPFALFGIDSYLSGVGSSVHIASVNDEAITAQELQDTESQFVAQIRSQNEETDPAIFQDIEFKRAILDQLITSKLVSQEIKNAGFYISDSQIGTYISGMPEFRRNGKFSQEQYDEVLKINNLTPKKFDEKIREDLGTQQVKESLKKLIYIPKDKIANWLEFYADTMELNVWSSAEFTGASYDKRDERWRLNIRRADGSERILHPRHVVMATGVSALPVMPNLSGQEDFQGELMHSSAYTSGAKWGGGKAIVLGTGNSGHDVAHDLCVSGVDTRIVQRSSSLIISLKEAQRVYEIYQQGEAVEDCDLVATASPYPLLVKGYKITAEACKNADAKLLEGLVARGFRLDNGDPDNTGYQMKYLRRGGGYYFNVGASDLIVDGEIGLLHYQDIERVVANGLLMKDGRVEEADVIVAATGYKNQQDVVRHFMGDAIANKIGQVWGFDNTGELRNMWCRTPQPGLWFTGGGLPHVRIFSKYLAQQIKACEVGLLDKNLEANVAPPMDLVA